MKLELICDDNIKIDKELLNYFKKLCEKEAFERHRNNLLYLKQRGFSTGCAHFSNEYSSIDFIIPINWLKELGINNYISCTIKLFNNGDVGGEISTQIDDPFAFNIGSVGTVYFVEPFKGPASALDAIVYINEKLKDETPETLASKFYKAQLDISKRQKEFLEKKISSLEKKILPK